MKNEDEMLVDALNKTANFIKVTGEEVIAMRDIIKELILGIQKMNHTFMEFIKLEKHRILKKD